ncbi:hypothetical protein [Micromonospora echinaurantiaca]|uniref:hypothetical protein n=1 Tax=Micromonospora echinaurantiaca TaxID=47857 RepID=UPI00342BA902
MNDNEERAVRTLLGRVADELPAGGVPAADLVTGGERMLRRRRFAVAGAAAVLTVVAVLGGTVLAGGPRAARTPTPADSGSPTPAGPPTVAPERFDPTRQPFRLGSLPPNVGHQTYETDVRMVTVNASVPDAISPGGPVEAGPIMAFSASVTVRMGARGVDVFFNERERVEDRRMGGPPPEVPLPGAPVAPVNGKPAFFYTHQHAAVLSWQYAPDGWIAISVREYDRPEQLARQIAEGLVWEERPVTVPFASVAAPGGVVLEGTEIRTFRGGWLDASLRYVLPENVGSVEVRADYMLGVSNGIFKDDEFKAGLTVAGRRAMADEFSNGTGVYRVAQLPGGCTGCVAEVNPETVAGQAAVGGRAGALDLAASIRLVDGWDDPASWRPA